MSIENPKGSSEHIISKEVQDHNNFARFLKASEGIYNRLDVSLSSDERLALSIYLILRAPKVFKPFLVNPNYSPNPSPALTSILNIAKKISTKFDVSKAFSEHPDKINEILQSILSNNFNIEEKKANEMKSNLVQILHENEIDTESQKVLDSTRVHTLRVMEEVTNEDDDLRNLEKMESTDGRGIDPAKVDTERRIPGFISKVSNEIKKWNEGDLLPGEVDAHGTLTMTPQMKEAGYIDLALMVDEKDVHTASELRGLIIHKGTLGVKGASTLVKEERSVEENVREKNINLLTAVVMDVIGNKSNIAEDFRNILEVNRNDQNAITIALIGFLKYVADQPGKYTLPKVDTLDRTYKDPDEAKSIGITTMDVALKAEVLKKFTKYIIGGKTDPELTDNFGKLKQSMKHLLKTIIDIETTKRMEKIEIDSSKEESKKDIQQKTQTKLTPLYKDLDQAKSEFIASFMII